MTDSPLARRVLWAATATLLVAGLLAAGVESGGGDDDTPLTASTSTTVAACEGGCAGGDGGDAGAGAGPSGPPGTAPPPESTTTPPPLSLPPTTAPRSTATTAAPGGAMPSTAAPRAGTYRYKETRPDDEPSGEVTLGVEDRGAAGDGRSLRITLTREEGSIVDDVRWSPTETRILTTKARSAFFSTDCDWAPDYLERRNDLKKGSTWTADSSCTAQAGTATVVLRREATARVTAEETVAVAGRSVRVWVVESRVRITANGQGGEGTAVERFSPELGLAVRATFRSENESYDLELLTPDPA